MAAEFAFSDSDLRARFNDHFNTAQRFSELLAREFGCALTVNPRRVYLVVISAYADVARYKNYHLTDPESDKADAVKRSSYLVKWICRFKPLQVESSDGADLLNQELDKTALANELLALHIAFSHLSDFAGKDFTLSEEPFWELVYDLLYRQVTEDSLMFLFNTLVRHVTENRIVQVL